MNDRSLLVVDDEPTFLNCLVRDLSPSGLRITTATNGEEGINRINAGFFDLVMTDLSMPIYNGFEVIQAAKQRSPQTMVIVVTGNEATENAVNAFLLGADDFVQKPCDTDELLCRFAKCLTKQDLLRKIHCYENFLEVCRRCTNKKGPHPQNLDGKTGPISTTCLHPTQHGVFFSGCCPLCFAEQHRDASPSANLLKNCKPYTPLR